jgi:sugar O-acyltransferase (sialic acid O-acetyltransferase NeuD family)
MKKEPLLLIGGGGHCKSIIDIIEIDGTYEIKGILDLAEKTGTKVLGYEIIGTDNDLEIFLKQFHNVFIAIGQIKEYTIRQHLFERIMKTDANLITLISPLAHVSQHSVIGKGTVIHHFANVNAGARIGENCIINTHANIEHDVTIGSMTHISTGVMINGDSRIGNGVFIGSNSTLGTGVDITNDVVIGACSFIKSNILEPGFYKGTPAKRNNP